MKAAAPSAPASSRKSSPDVKHPLPAAISVVILGAAVLDGCNCSPPEPTDNPDGGAPVCGEHCPAVKLADGGFDLLEDGGYKCYC